MNTRSKDKNPKDSEKPESSKSVDSDGWTDEDKLLLLNAVKLHGVSNIHEISKLVPNRKKQDIQAFIKRQIRRYRQYRLINIVHLSSGPVKCLRLTKDLEKSSLDLWLDILRKAAMFPLKHFNALSFFMKLMSDFGEHDPPENEDDIDFKLLYLYMSQLLEGMKPCTINDNTQAFVRKCLEDLAVEHRDSAKFTDQMTFLKNINDHFFTRIKSNDKYPENSLMEALNDVHNSKILNPLNIPIELTKRKTA